LRRRFPRRNCARGARVVVDVAVPVAHPEVRNVEDRQQPPPLHDRAHRAPLLRRRVGARRVVRTRVEHDGGAARQGLEVGAEAAEVERARRGVVVAVRRHLEPRRAEDVVVDRPRRRGDVDGRARRLGADDARGEREAAGARERLRRVHAVGVRVAEDEPRRRLVRRAEAVDRQVLLVVARREQRRLGLAHALEDERLALLGAVGADGDGELGRVRVGDVAVAQPEDRVLRAREPTEEGGGHLAAHAAALRVGGIWRCDDFGAAGKVGFGGHHGRVRRG